MSALPFTVTADASKASPRPSQAASPIDLVLSRLDKAKKQGKGWQACCPAHPDKSPSLSIAEGAGGRLLLHCFAGCEYRDIMAAIGLEPKDGFTESLSPVARLEYRRQSITKAREFENLILNAGGNADADLSDEDVSRLAIAKQRIKLADAEIADIEQQISDQPDQPGWQHPLTRVIELGSAPRPPSWILPYFISECVAIIAGAHGVGKTTALMPLAMAAAGLHETDYALAPHEWRHVVYITEDSHQVERIIAGYAPTVGLTASEVGERVHIVEAARMPPENVVKAGAWYRETYTRTVTTATGKIVDLLPLIVFDTKAAVFELENENDNAEASKMISTIKQRFEGLPVWIVGHVSKGDLSRDGAKSGMPTLRGASAFEADANQILYLVKEKDDTRWLVRGKTRFEAKWDELMIHTSQSKTYALNVFDEKEELILRWAVARPQDKTRRELNAEAGQAAKRVEREHKKAELLDCINNAYGEGEPLNISGLASRIGGNKSNAMELIREVIKSGWAAEITVPTSERTHHSRTKFLVGLTNGEREQYQATGELPAEKQVIPDSWKKQPKPSTPKVEGKE